MPGNGSSNYSNRSTQSNNSKAGCIGCLIPFIAMFVIFMIATVFSIIGSISELPSEMEGIFESFGLGFVVILVIVIAVIASSRRKVRDAVKNQSGPTAPTTFTVPSRSAAPSAPSYSATTGGSIPPKDFQVQSAWSRARQSGQSRTVQNRSSQSWTTPTRTSLNTYSTTCPHCGAFVQLPRGTTKRCSSCGKPVIAPVTDNPFFS